MKVLFDTSVLVAALVSSHPAHAKSFYWLEQTIEQKHQGFISAHTLAELYAILTRLPVRPPISAQEATKLIEESVIDVFEVVALSIEDYRSVLQHLAALNLIGGIIYDSLIMHPTTKIELDLILTLNERDFKRIEPALSEKISLP